MIEEEAGAEEGDVGFALEEQVIGADGVAIDAAVFLEAMPGRLQ